MIEVTKKRIADFGEVGNARHRELMTRIGMSVCLAITVSVFGEPFWALAWFVIAMVGQAVDVRVFRPLRQINGDHAVPSWRLVLCVASVALNVVHYQSINILFWVSGGDAGRLLLVFLLGGSMLHACLHAHRTKILLAASIVPMLGYLYAIPTWAYLNDGLDAPTLLSIYWGGLVYLGHLFVVFMRFGRSQESMAKVKEEIEFRKRRAEDAALFLEKRVASRVSDLEMAKQDAIRANAAKSDFVATVSHELRTPLNAVIGYSELMKDQADVDGRADDSQDLDRILRASDRLLHLIEDILDFSKIESGNLQIETATLSIDDMLKDVEATVRPGIEWNRNSFLVQKVGDLGIASTDGAEAQSVPDQPAVERRKVH